MLITAAIVLIVMIGIVNETENNEIIYNDICSNKRWS